MIAFVCNGRRVVLAGLVLISMVAGCRKPGLPNPTAASSTPSTDLATPRTAKPQPTPQPLATEPQFVPPPKVESPQIDKEASVPMPKAPEIPMSDEEQRELAAARDWVGKTMWSVEIDPEHKRQRPVGLIVLRPEGLPSVIPTSLDYAEGLANVNWDVNLMLHATGNDRRDLTALKGVRARIDKINADIASRNEAEAGKLPASAAPLRPLPAPGLFTNVRELEESIDGWLAKNFLMLKKSGAPPRAPFGGVSFNGHGKSVRIDPKGDRNDKANLTLQFQVADDEWFDLSRLDHLVLRKYQAPVWVLTDLCRPVKAGKKGAPGDAEPPVAKLKPREFENADELPEDAKKLIQDCEQLRAKVSAGFLHNGGTGVTRLNTTNMLTRIDDTPEFLLHHQIGRLTEREETPKDIARANFKHVPSPVTSLDLSMVEGWATEQFKAHHTKIHGQQPEPPPAQRPELARGTLSDQTVIFTTLRGKDAYPPQYPNLLAGGLLPSSGGFTVPEFDGAKNLNDPEHYGPVTIVRKQDKFDSDFKSLFKFKEPYTLDPKVHYQLVLQVSASGAKSTDKIRFTTGVYDTKFQLLNPSFTNYNKAESFANPITCNGVPRLIHVPLTWFNDPEADPKPTAIPQPEVAVFEIQASPLQPETSWKQGAALTIHAAYLVSNQLTDEQLKTDIKHVKAKTSFDKMCIWDVPLHAKPEAVSSLSELNTTVMKQSVKDHSGLWGIAGEVYPKMHIESGTRQLRLKVDVEAGSKIDKNAEVCLCLYSSKRVILACIVPLDRAVAKEQVIPIVESGMVQEVVVVVKNHSGPLQLTRLDIEKNPQQGK